MLLHHPTAPAPHARAEHLPAEVSTPYLLTTSVSSLTADISWPPHTHTEHELLWLEHGVAAMTVDGKRWIITPGMGLWVPAGVPHAGTAEAASSLRVTYFAAAPWNQQWADPAALRLDSALRELLMRLRTADIDTAQRVRAQQVCIDLLHLAEPVHLEVPIPTDPRLSPLVDAVMRDPADDRSLEQWAFMLNMTSRTLTRLFASEVAMGFARWRRFVRMQAALGELSNGRSVKTVARGLGYGSSSAFVAAFRKTVGQTPGEAITLAAS